MISTSALTPAPQLDLRLHTLTGEASPGLLQCKYITNMASQNFFSTTVLVLGTFPRSRSRSRLCRILAAGPLACVNLRRCADVVMCRLRRRVFGFQVFVKFKAPIFLPALCCGQNVPGGDKSRVLQKVACRGLGRIKQMHFELSSALRQN